MGIGATATADQHATKARDLAEKASNMRENGDEAGAELAAEVSQAHGLASIATVLASSSVEVSGDLNTRAS